MSPDKSDGDTHDEIVRLETHIEELAAKIESCRKFTLASRVSMAGGGIALAAMLLGAIRFDPAAMAAAIAALLGGIVVWGSNGSTAKEAARELMRAAQARRIVAAQRQIIEGLKTTDSPTLDAERTLMIYESSLRHLEAHEDKLRKERKNPETKKPGKWSF